MVDFGYAQDVVDVADDGEAVGRNEIGRRVANITTFGVHVQALDVGGAVPVGETVAFYLNESVEITLACCGIGESDLLVSTIGCDGSTSALFSGCSSCRGWS